MRNRNLWVIFTMILALTLLSACARTSGTQTKEPPSTVEEIEGSEFKLVKLTEKAAKRLGIETTLVREEPVVREQILVGEVVTDSGDGTNANRLGIRVPLSQTDIKMVARDTPAVALPLISDDNEEHTDDEGENGWRVELDEALGFDDDEGSVVYYLPANVEANLTSGQRVFVNVPMVGSNKVLKVIPFAALVYDTVGNTFVYVKEPSSLSFVRHQVVVDFIEGDMVYLSEGPPVGTEVVTVGVAELYGAETGVSK